MMYTIRFYQKNIKLRLLRLQHVKNNIDSDNSATACWQQTLFFYFTLFVPLYSYRGGPTVGVSKRGTHFENNLRIPKDSCEIVNTLPSDIFKVSAISRNQCSQNVDVNGPHHRCFELIVSSSFNQPMAVERGSSHELVRSMVGAVYVHVLRTLHATLI